MRSTITIAVVTCVAVVGAGTLAGCGAITSEDAGRIQASDLPSAVRHVAENETDFAQDSENAFGEVAPGTVMDALSGLDGCWGSYFRLVADEDASGVTAGTPLLDTCEAYSFDSATGAITYCIYQQSVYGTLGVYGLYEGTYTVLDDSSINATWDHVRVRDPSTGEVQTTDFTDGADPVEWVLLITLNGDELRVGGAEEEGEAAAEGSAADYEQRVFTRFTCS